ncbi:MAG: SxtJ family membrane protein [Alphaproteobacteria bacterium]|nr:SxtJ family membrane protein [Alphaproteobacteria bacterium]
MTHENIGSAHDVKMGSERAFGFVFAGFFAILSGLAWWNASSLLIYWLITSALFLAVALVAPRALTPLNRLWFRFGLLLHTIVSPVIMGLLFFVTITPIGWLMRLFGARPLNLKFDSAAQSYWIKRDPPGPPPASLKNQF